MHINWVCNSQPNPFRINEIKSIVYGIQSLNMNIEENVKFPAVTNFTHSCSHCIGECWVKIIWSDLCNVNFVWIHGNHDCMESKFS